MNPRFYLKCILRIFRNPQSLFRFINSLRYSLNCSNIKYKYLPICIFADEYKVKIKKSDNSKLLITGRVKFINHLGNTATSVIYLGDNARLEIKGDLEIGPGVRIMVGNGGCLTIGGKLKETASGFTENVKIMCKRHIQIGVDLICAWNVFITDSDWHQVKEQNDDHPVIIGDHVWITPNVSILKGTKIGDNCIICNSSVVVKGEFPNSSLIAGNPAKRVAHAPVWRR